MSSAERNKEEEEKEKPISEIKPDAIAADGVLSLLNEASSSGSDGGQVGGGQVGGGIRHERTLSIGTRSQIDAQKHQLQFLTMRTQLTQYLEDTVSMLNEVIALNKESSLSVIPPNMTVLGIDVRLGAGGSIQPSASAGPSLVDSRLHQVVQHALKLQARLADTTSRVLVTGDLNAGKSSLCNALIRRPILPVDQQPCTDVFCEVVDYEKNHGIEEVHAVLKGSDAQKYDVDDHKTYETFSLEQLDNLVHESAKYKLLVVYVKDPRPPSQSLLNNGVVDICLIDAPGLNVSAVTTTELFGRQEEIDLVIFVVSAENHFTQSAKEFVSDAAREKSLLFIAVNNYDKIKDKERCRNRVLDQVGQLAPETHKGASDFVHFVTASAPSGNDGPGPDEGPEGSQDRDGIDRLESSLRTFVLEKRSASKLLPARTYLRNVLADLLTLTDENREQAAREIGDLGSKLAELAPEIDESVLEYAGVSDQIDRDIEKLSRGVFADTEEFIATTVSSIGESPVTEWNGIWNVFAYAEETRRVLVEQVVSAVTRCEDSAREVTGSAVDSIKKLGVLHVGEQPAFLKMFNQSAMFSRRKDNLNRLIRADFGVADLFDVAGLLERPLPVLATSKRALVSSATSNASLSSAVGGAVAALSIYQGALLPGGPAATANSVSLITRIGSVVGSPRLAIPAAVVAVLALGAWVIYELPRTIPRKLARKVAFEIDEMGYVRTNAERIAAECRKVLRVPAQDVRAAFQTKLEGRTRQRDEFERHLRQAEHVLEVFDKLHGRVTTTFEDVKRLAI